MSKANGKPLLNGTGRADTGERVLVDYKTPVDRLEPIPVHDHFTPAERVAVRIIAGWEDQSYADLGKELGCSAANIAHAVRKVCDAWDLKSPREHTRATCAEGAKKRHRKKEAAGSQPAASPSNLARSNAEDSHPRK